MLEFTEDIGGCAEELTVAAVDVMKAGVRVFRWREGDRGQLSYLLSGCGSTRSKSDLSQSSLRRFVSICCLMWDRQLKGVEWVCEGIEMVEMESWISSL